MDFSFLWTCQKLRMKWSYSKCFDSVVNWFYKSHINHRSQFQLTVMIKSLLMRLFMVLASFSLCHLSEFLISSLSTIWSLFIFPHLLIIPRFLFILFSLFLCCATSAYLFRLYLRLLCWLFLFFPSCTLITILMRLSLISDILTFSRSLQHQQVRERIWIVSFSFMFWVPILFAL